MLFQTLDNKNHCVGVYSEGVLNYEELPEELSHTWSYASYLEGREIEYASLYRSQKMSEMCPEHLKEEWDEISGRLRAYYKSFRAAKICMDENCFFDLVPERYLVDLCEIKNKITEYVFENYEKPENYQHTLEVTKMIHEINHQRLKLNPDSLKSKRANLQARTFLKKIRKNQPYCKYIVSGTKTGRLTTMPNSFPILTMKKEFRTVLEPQNDWFVELDFNAAELRVLLSLAGKDQPEIDIHNWNIENVFRGLGTREEAKKRAFAWLYNPQSEDQLMNSFYDRDSVLGQYWDGEYVETLYNRKIPADRFHALNYIIQSTCADMVLEQAYKIRRLLAHKRSTIALIVHDSVVIDMADEDRQELLGLVKSFSSTRLGKFMVNLHAGKNYGSLRELKIHG